MVLDNVSRETFRPKMLCPKSVKHFIKYDVKHGKYDKNKGFNGLDICISNVFWGVINTTISSEYTEITRKRYSKNNDLVIDI